MLVYFIYRRQILVALIFRFLSESFQIQVNCFRIIIILLFSRFTNLHTYIYSLSIYICICTHPRLGFFGIFQKYNRFHCRHLWCCISVSLQRCCLFSTEFPARPETYYYSSKPSQMLETLVMPKVFRSKLYVCSILCC